MTATIASRPPHWYGIPVRVALLTFLGTLLSFALVLFFSIIGTVLVSRIRGIPLQMRIAYRDIAIPAALVAAAIIFVLALISEIRHYRQAKSLAAIERMN